MTTLRLFAGLAAAAAVSTSCQTTGAISEADQVEIRRIEQEFATAVVTNDIDKILAQRTADIVWYPPNSPVLTGRASIRKSLEANPPSIRFAVTASHTEGYGDLAYNRGTYTATSVIATDTLTDRGKYLQVWRRQRDGSWLIAAEIWNSDTPAPVPAQIDAVRR